MEMAISLLTTELTTGNAQDDGKERDEELREQHVGTGRGRSKYKGKYASQRKAGKQRKWREGKRQ